MRRALLLLLIAGCGGSTAASTTTTVPGVPQPQPDQVLRQFLDILAAGDYDKTGNLVDERQLVILTAVEGATVEETRVLLRDGASPALRKNFWSSFTEGAGLLGGVGLQEVVIDPAEPFAVEGSAFVALPVRAAGSTESFDWIMRRAAGGWIIDMFATFGSTFSTPLRLWLRTLEGEGASDIRTELAEQVVSFKASTVRHPDRPSLEQLVAELGG